MDKLHDKWDGEDRDIDYDDPEEDKPKSQENNIYTSLAMSAQIISSK